MTDFLSQGIIYMMMVCCFILMVLTTICIVYMAIMMIRHAVIGPIVDWFRNR